MRITTPWTFFTDDSSGSAEAIARLLRSGEARRSCTVYDLERLYVIGPDQTLAALANQVRAGACFLPDRAEELARLRPVQDWVAKGLYIPATYQGTDLPVVSYYHPTGNPHGHPVMTEELKLRPGEFLIVPESSELLCTVSYQDGRSDNEHRLPDRYQWWGWPRTTDNKSYTVIPDRMVRPMASIGREERLIPTTKLPKALLAQELPSLPVLLNAEQAYFHLAPFFPDETWARFRQALNEDAPWIRRRGDLYAQQVLELSPWSERGGCPPVVREVLQGLASPEAIRRLRTLTGTALTQLHEVAAYRMSAGEFLHNHTDGNYGGTLRIRVNWLVQSPPERRRDMRFWSPDEASAPIHCAPAIENAITVFRIGMDTPHDIAPIEIKISRDRINLLISYG